MPENNNQVLQQDPPSKARAIYNALQSDAKYKDFLPETFELFAEKLSDPNNSSAVYGALSNDDKYSQHLPDSAGFANIFSVAEVPVQGEAPTVQPPQDADIDYSKPENIEASFKKDYELAFAKERDIISEDVQKRYDSGELDEEAAQAELDERINSTGASLADHYNGEMNKSFDAINKGYKQQQDYQIKTGTFVPPKADRSKIERGILKQTELGLSKTWNFDRPASLAWAEVARIRRRKNAIQILKEQPKVEAYGKMTRNSDLKAVKGYENIDVKSAERLKDAVEGTTDKINDLENKRWELTSVLMDRDGYVSSGGRNPTPQKVDEKEYQDKIKKISAEIDALKPVEKRQEDAWNAYMKPILGETAFRAQAYADVATELEKRGEKEFGGKLSLSWKDTEGLYEILEYAGAQTGLSAPYGAMGMLDPTEMIKIEQGSIEGDILNSVATEMGISVEEVLEQGLDQKGADIAFNEGLKAGLFEFAGTTATLLVPWTRLGLAAGTKMPLEGFKRVLLQSFRFSSGVVGGQLGEYMTEYTQTGIELAAKYKALGFSDDEIKKIIEEKHPDARHEGGMAGFVASGTVSSASSTVATVKEVRAENKLRNEDIAERKFLGDAYESVSSTTGKVTENVAPQSELAEEKTEEHTELTAELIAENKSQEKGEVSSEAQEAQIEGVEEVAPVQSDVEVTEKPVKADKLKEAKESLATGLEMIARLSANTKNIAQIEGESFKVGFKHIGDGLIKLGEATVENVIQKVKEYLKKNNISFSIKELEDAFTKRPALAKDLRTEESKKESVVADKENREDMDSKFMQDESGENYVFRHYSNEKKDKLSPSTKASGKLLTSPEEASAVNSAGGAVMYYTQEDQKESGTGNVAHEVTIPKDKVYVFNSDKDGFFDEAEKQFKAKFPNQAFTPNHQAAWVAKVANQQGFDMMVTKWGNKGQWRAQTTKSLTPDVAKESVSETHNKEGGSSINQKGENLAGKEGYSVSPYSENTTIVKGKKVTDEDIETFKEKNKELLKDSNNFIGTWYDKDSGNTYIDVSIYEKDLEKAKKIGIKHNQKAIFDLKNFEEIDTEGTGEAKEISKASSVALFNDPSLLNPTRQPNGRTKVSELGNALDQRAKDEGYAMSVTDAYTEEGINKISDAMADDIENQLKNDDSGIGWYDAKINSAMELMSRLHPELATSKEAHLRFTLLTAFISQNNNVEINFNQANQAYTEYKKTGKLPTLTYAGKSGNIIKSNIASMFALVDKIGYEKVTEILSDVKTKKEWENLGYEFSTAELATEKLTGAMILMGSKIGSFWGNLNGDFTTLTADLWFARNWNRYTGNTSSNLGIENSKKGILKDLTDYKNRRLLYGYSKNELRTDDAKFMEWINKVAIAYINSGYKDKLPINIKANTIYKNLKGSLIDIPRNGSERRAMRQAVEKVQGKLVKRGFPKLDIADIQAILWYNEKDLYSQYKAVNSASEKTDYETAAQNVLARAGIDNTVNSKFKRGEQSGTSGGTTVSDKKQGKTSKAEQAKNELADGLAMFARVTGVTKNIAPVEGDSMANAIKLIGQALIDAGLATVENVAQKVKEYIKSKGLKVDNKEVDSVYPSKGEAKTLKEKLTEKISSDKPKQSDYIKRRLAEFANNPELVGEIEKIGIENSPKKVLAESESEKLVNDLQKKFGEVEGLMLAAELARDNKLPALMSQMVFPKVYLRLLALGEIDKSNEVLKMQSVDLTEASHKMIGAQSGSSPQQTVSRAFAGLAEAKQKALETEFKDGVTYSKALEDITKELTNLKEAYEKLQKEGKISEKNLPTPRRKSRVEDKADSYKSKARQKKKDGLALFKKGLRKQRGEMSMNLNIDGDTLKGLAMMLEGEIYAAGGNVLAAFEKLKKEVVKEFGNKITEKDIENAKKDLLELSKEAIEEFKKEKQKQVVSELLKPKGKETNAERKARAEATKNIVEDFNEGKEDISKNLSEVANFEKIGEADIKEIMDLSEKWADLNMEGKFDLAETAWYNLMLKMESLKLSGNLWHEALLDVWYTGVLSGFSTIARSLKGSATTSFMYMMTRLMSSPKVAPLMIKEMWKASSGTMANYAHVIRTGKTRINITDQGRTSGIPWTRKITTEKFSNLSLKDKILKYPSSAVIYLFRNIPAFDQILTNPMIAGNMALYEFDRTDKKGLKLKERLEITRKAIATEKTGEIKKVVDAEIAERKANGEKISWGEANRRATEIKNAMLDQELLKKAISESAEAALVSTPTGHLGMIYNGLLNWVEIKKGQDKYTVGSKLMVKGIIPFIRVAFNWANAGLNYTPVGAVRGAVVKTKWTKDSPQTEKTGFERREQIVKAAQGALLYSVVLMSMFDWDDDEGLTLKDEKDMWIDVHGDLTGKWWEDKSISRDSQPWSVRFRHPLTGNWTGWMKYRDNPIGMALAPIGMLRDRIKLKDFKLKVEGNEDDIKKIGVDALLAAGAQGSFDYAMSQSFNQSFQTLGRAFKPEEEDELSFRNELDLVLNPLGGFIPAAPAQLYNQYKALNDTPEKEAATWYDKLAKKMPLIDGIVKNDQYDVFGIPIVKDFDAPLIPDIVLKMAKDNLTYRENYKEWKLLWKYEEVTLGSFRKNKINGVSLTDDEQNSFQRIAGEEMRELVDKKYKRLDKYDAFDLQIKLNLIYETAKDRATNSMKKEMKKNKRFD